MSGRILIADDVATNRIVYKVKLGAACYAPLFAETGASCLRLAHQEKPDLILLDMVLPDMSGTEVLHRLRADPATAMIPVVVFSAQDSAALRMEALAAGADDFLTKSVDDLILMARLRNLLRGNEAIADLASDSAPIRAMGFAEPISTFRLPGTIAVITHRPETAMHLRRDLSGHLPDQITMISREAALAETGRAASHDIFVIEDNADDPMGGLRLMSELRSHAQTRHAAVCIVKSRLGPAEAAMAYDLGADDVVEACINRQEFGLRLSRLMQRKREADRWRASVRDGLRMAMIDPLTGLYNRRYAIRQLTEIAAKANGSRTPFAVMVMDLDRFKAVNDRFGHPAGDAVLVEVARRMIANIRTGDLLARIGGEEFLIALPETDLAAARVIAERLCNAVQETAFALPGFAPIHITASIGLAICEGVSDWQQEQEQIPHLIERADRALMVAKSGGRNKVTISRAA
ncbi:diguanylate cyclase [Pseudorhodobacter sp.]|uniref:diguanylate cyclase n=1 Tax=Pseudorhodobacter sp. TaxID=1934400 RepID=UPI0026491B8C|nr:diguanylate cyclase [Pseudorhodobacter sp.]MDN5787375.1 diguanylate cyclase [Pseudorhodobacter sp.]